MPELPEVETIARTLGPQICGQRIASIEVLLPKAVQAGAERLPALKGARVQSVWRRAKLLLVSLRLDPGQRGACSQSREPRVSPALPVEPAGADMLLVFHLKMTGRFFVHPPGTMPLKHTRLIFDMADGKRLFFDDVRSFGYCRVMRPEELALWPFWRSLGPEPLDISAGALAGHFAEAFAGRRVPVKTALLDQRLVAGIGNIYADEALFQAGVRPTARAGAIPPQRLEALAQALQSVLRQSIEECGSSIRDYRDAFGNAGAFQNAFAVYGRKGQSCRRCGNALSACRVGGRGTVFCADCQADFS